MYLRSASIPGLLALSLSAATLRASSRALEEAFLRAEVPDHQRGGLQFPMISYVRPANSKPLKSSVESRLKTALTEFFTAPTNNQQTWKFSGELEKLLREGEPAVRVAAWEAFRDAPIHDAMKQDYDAKQVRFDKHLSPYTVKSVGT